MIKENFSLKSKQQFAGSPPTLTQFYSLIKQLQENENVRKHWIVDNKTAFDKIQYLSMEEYRRFLRLLFTKNYSKINKLMEELRFKRNVDSYAPSDVPF